MAWFSLRNSFGSMRDGDRNMGTDVARGRTATLLRPSLPDSSTLGSFTTPAETGTMNGTMPYVNKDEYSDIDTPESVAARNRETIELLAKMAVDSTHASANALLSIPDENGLTEKDRLEQLYLQCGGNPTELAFNIPRGAPSQESAHDEGEFTEESVAALNSETAKLLRRI